MKIIGVLGLLGVMTVTPNIRVIRIISDKGYYGLRVIRVMTGASFDRAQIALQHTFLASLSSSKLAASVQIL
jgi:hypothetical protein